MKLFQLAKLGHRNLTHHKKQTIFTVIVIGSLFSILVAVQFIIQGLENFYVQHNSELFNGKTYIAAQACRRSELDSHHDIITRCVNNNNQMDEQCFQNQIKRPAPCSTNRQQVNDLFKTRAKPYGGEVVGNIEIRNTNIGSQFHIYPISIFKDRITADLSTKPQNIPAVMLRLSQAADLLNIKTNQIYSRQAKLNIINEIKAKVIGKILKYNGQSIFVAGILPYGTNGISIARHIRDVRPLDQLLNKVSFYQESGLGESGLLFLNDQSDAIKKIINESTFYAYQAILKFNSPDQAYNYYKNEIDYISPSLFTSNRPRQPRYLIRELVTGSFNARMSLGLKRFELSFAIYTLLVTAVIIIVFTFLRLVNQDNKLIALYRSLGATARDVWFIYLWYVFELCLLTIFFALSVGALLALGVSWHYSADFNAGASLFYAKHITKLVPFIGFNLEIVKIIGAGAIVLSAPIVSILTIDQLSMKNVARRLKKQ